MVDGESGRARRAWGPDESEIDDTPVQDVYRARRGSADPEPDQDPTDAGLGDEPAAADDVAGGPVDDDPTSVIARVVEPDPGASANPFARPGSDAAQAPAPTSGAAPSGEEPAVTPIPAPVLPRSSFQGPAPRRSALSTTSPDEVPEPQGQQHWFDAHRGRLFGFAAAGLVIALVLGLGGYFISRGLNPQPADPSGSPSATASPSASSSAAPAEVADLLTGEDLAALAPASEWAEVSTTESVSEHEGFPICITKEVGEQVNPTHSLQRSLGTTTDDKLAALHRIDVYANPESATTVMDARIAALSACSDVPVLIVRAAEISGLAERTFQLTVLEQGFHEGKAVNTYHTVLLTQEGSALQLVDAKRLNQPVAADAVATALVRPQTALNEAQGVEDALAPTAAETVVPPAEPKGWLITSDLPRIRQGQGRWQARPAEAVSITGTGCEDLTLASPTGPTKGEETKFSLTQDDQVPAIFGIDQVLYTFETPQAAAQFSSRLGKNLTDCAKRVNTAKVEKTVAVTTPTAVEAQGSSVGFLVTQSQGGKASSSFQVLLSVVDTKVSYTVITTEGDYRFADEQLTALANRIAVRASQA